MNTRPTTQRHEFESQKEVEPTGLSLPRLKAAGNDLVKVLEARGFVKRNSPTYSRQMNAKIAIINHQNGKRIQVNKAILEQLGATTGDSLEIIVIDQKVLLRVNHDGEGLVLKKSGTLYSSELVRLLTDEFKFDFSQQSTHHLLQVTYRDYKGQPLAVVTQ